MKFTRPTTRETERFAVRGEVSPSTHPASGFTLVEALAALMFLAIVIPIAIQGLQIASLAGEVAQRKNIAARVAERILNENVASTNSNQSSQSGKTMEGVLEFDWTLHAEPWAQNATNVFSTGSAASSVASVQPIVNAAVASQTTLTLLSVEVVYLVQNRPYSVRLCTVTNPQQ
jgi:type II secretory pathway pseudopilin PulG